MRFRHNWLDATPQKYNNNLFFISNILSYNLSATTLSSAVNMFLQDSFGVASSTLAKFGRHVLHPGVEGSLR
jgi:hypothetical protein